MEKNTGKVREKSGNFVIPEKWEPWYYAEVSILVRIQIWIPTRMVSWMVTVPHFKVCSHLTSFSPFY